MKGKGIKLGMKGKGDKASREFFLCVFLAYLERTKF